MVDEIAVEDMEEMEEIPVPEDESAEPRLTAPDPDGTDDDAAGQPVSGDEN